MNIKKHIPNTITLGNLFCGCLAIIKIFEGDLVWASYLVGIAAVLDFFDGFVARMLKVSSPIGKDLDSLADMVTFGVVPGIMMFKLIGQAILQSEFSPAQKHLQDLLLLDQIQRWTTDIPLSVYPFSQTWFMYVGLIITIFSCIRLAKFNNDTRQSESFIGLNTPSNSMIICSFPLILEFQPQYHFFTSLITNPIFILVLSVILSFLLVSEIPFFSLKFKNFGWADNKIRYILLGSSVILLLTLKFVGIPLIIVLYTLLSVINNIVLKPKIKV